MTINPISVVVETPEEAAHWSTVCKERANALIDLGKRALLRVEEAEDVRTLQQNRFYFGAVLRDISEQARTVDDDGVEHRWTKDAWHNLFKRQFLPMVLKRTKVAGRKHPVVTRTIGSTKGLSVRKMSVYLEKIMAYAVTDLNVRFRELRWEDYTEE